VHGIIGPNGAGKTTLLNAISRIVPWEAGSITVNGAPVDRQPAHRFARLGVARTFQHPQLISGATVQDNVELGLYGRASTRLLEDLFSLPTRRGWERHRRESALSAIRDLGLGPLAQKPVSELPYGVRKVVDVARAWASAPSLLLLDEPTAGLDDGEMRHLAEFLKTLKGRTTVVVIVHHVEFISEVADMVTVFDAGRKLAEGLPVEIRRDPAVIEAYMGART
jgi:branched-chain amino acid transport system ATP-binding protein